MPRFLYPTPVTFYSGGPSYSATADTDRNVVEFAPVGGGDLITKPMISPGWNPTVEAAWVAGTLAFSNPNPDDVVVASYPDGSPALSCGGMGGGGEDNGFGAALEALPALVADAKAKAELVAGVIASAPAGEVPQNVVDAANALVTNLADASVNLAVVTDFASQQK